MKVKIRTLAALPRIVWRAVRLGCMDSVTLNQKTRTSYATSGDFGERSHNLSGLWPNEEAVVRDYFTGLPRILVAGAGGGREVIALAKMGFQVVGFDCCKDLVSACSEHLRTEGLKAEVLEAPPDSLPDGLGVFDGIMVARGVFHHIPGRTRRIEFLVNCRAHLAGGGPLYIADFFTRTDQARFLQFNHTIAGFIRQLRGSREPAELGDWLSEGFQHAFTRAELEAELAEAGFQLEKFQKTINSLAQAVARVQPASRRRSATVLP